MEKILYKNISYKQLVRAFKVHDELELILDSKQLSKAKIILDLTVLAFLTKKKMNFLQDLFTGMKILYLYFIVMIFYRKLSLLPLVFMTFGLIYFINEQGNLVLQKDKKLTT